MVPYVLDVRNGSASADLEDILSCAAGPEQGSLTLGATDTWHMVLATFKPAGASTTTTSPPTTTTTTSPTTSTTTTSTTSLTTTTTTSSTTTTTMPFCQGQPNGTACNDGNPCTGPDKCHNGVCNGKVLPNGTGCDDGNACTANDICQSGVCVGSCQVGTVCGGGCTAKHCGLKGSVCSCQ